MNTQSPPSSREITRQLTLARNLHLLQRGRRSKPSFLLDELLLCLRTNMIIISRYLPFTILLRRLLHPALFCSSSSWRALFFYALFPLLLSTRRAPFILFRYLLLFLTLFYPALSLISCHPPRRLFFFFLLLSYLLLLLSLLLRLHGCMYLLGLFSPSPAGSCSLPSCLRRVRRTLSW